MPGHSGDSTDSYSLAGGLSFIRCNDSISGKTVTDANFWEGIICTQTIISSSVLGG